MSWKKYFKAVDNYGGQLSPISGQNSRGPSYGSGGYTQFNWDRKQIL